jgi:FkbM family methyltransferase
MIKIQVASYLYEQVNLHSHPQNIVSKFHRRIYIYLYKFILRFSEPVIRVKVGQKYLYMKAAHQLPVLKRHHPHYDTALPRLCSFLKEKQGYLTLIDVGANIGDTVSLVTDKVSGKFLCIEGDRQYFDFLLLNTKDIPNVVCEHVLVSDEETLSKVSLVGIGGTSYVAAHSPDEDNYYSTTTVDKLLENHQDFCQANILKVDTDGYDYKVLRGCTKLINQSRPVLYFELSPWHLLSLGGEQPLSIFEHLFQLGYSQALFYDNLGFPMMLINISRLEIVSQLINYASIKNNFYYDVLLFNDIHKISFHEFHQEELKKFPNYKWF